MSARIGHLPIHSVDYTYEDDRIEYTCVVQFTAGPRYSGGPHEPPHGYQIDVVAIDLQEIVSYRYDPKQGIVLGFDSDGERTIAECILLQMQSDPDVLAKCSEEFHDERVSHQ